MAKQRRKKKSKFPKKKKYTSLPVEKARASVLSKIIFILIVLLYFGILTYLNFKYERYPRGGYDRYPGMPHDLD